MSETSLTGEIIWTESDGTCYRSKEGSAEEFPGRIIAKFKYGFYDAEKTIPTFYEIDVRMHPRAATWQYGSKGLYADHGEIANPTVIVSPSKITIAGIWTGKKEGPCDVEIELNR